MNQSFNFDLFPDESQAILPFLVAPKVDELFSSWVVRLAHVNYSKAYSFTKSIFKTTTFWSRDIDRYTPEIFLEILSKKTKRNIDNIRALTLQGFEGKLFQSDKEYRCSNWIMPLGIYHRTWKNNGLMYCPLCLAKAEHEPFYKRSWRLSFFILCPDCQIMLHDHCPSCKRPVIFFRSELGKKNIEPSRYISRCYNCNYDLRRSLKIKANTQQLMLQKRLSNILEYGHSEKIIYPHLYFDILRYWIAIFLSKRPSFRDLQIRVYEEINEPFENPKGGYSNRFETLDINQRSKPLLAAWWILEDWPDRFIALISKSKLYSNDLLRDLRNPPFWYVSVINEYFFKSNVNRYFNTPDYNSK